MRGEPDEWRMSYMTPIYNGGTGRRRTSVKD